MRKENPVQTCILAPNPSPLTGPGTNTFLIGRRHVAVIDPGPDIASHRAAILQAADGRISHIFVTHAHLDHSEGAAALAHETGAPILAFGTATAGRSARMARLAEAGLAGGGEGLDHAFAPDITLRDNDVTETPDWSLRAIHTPGHMGNHLSFALDDTVFCGDLVLGWASTLVSPPDGDLSDYFRSLERLHAEAPKTLLPAHGDAVESVTARLNELAEHRRMRTSQILARLRSSPGSAAELARRIYDDIPPTLLAAATRNVFAHLIALQDIGAVTAPENSGADSQFSIK